MWFAALDTIDTPDALLRALLGLLGIEPRSQPDLESLIDGLRFRESLLILDNCEHLLDAVAAATNAIVSSCPGVRVLATPTATAAGRTPYVPGTQPKPR